MLLPYCQALAIRGNVQAQPSTLGNRIPDIRFTAGADVLLPGVAALHSFWYEEAAAQFRECMQAEPDFMMGYWGVKATYNTLRRTA